MKPHPHPFTHLKLLGDSCTYPKHAISAGFNFKIGGFFRQNQQKKPKARAKLFFFVHFWILCY
jgi:hypothetical protein